MADEKTMDSSIENASRAIKHLLNKVAAWENYWRIMKSEELLERLNRKWHALAMARRLRYLLIQDLGIFEQEKIKIANAVRRDNPRLADNLEKFNAEKESTIPNLGKLLAALNTNQQFAESFIKTHAHELISWINSLKDPGLDGLRQLIIEISGAEIAELNKCIADLESWTDFRVGNDVQFFRNRVKAYVGGGKLENKDFAGLGKFFKDWEIVKNIKSSAALKRLLTHQLQLEWFSRVRETIAYSVKDPNWTGFYGPTGFYSNLVGGKNYVRIIRERFGNAHDAAYLKMVYENGSAGEVPELWLPHIDEILTRLKNPSYINSAVIVPARDDLIRIFSKRKEELAAINIKEKLEELAAALKDFFRKALAKSGNLIKFDSLMGKEQKQLEKELNSDKTAFINVLLDHGDAVIDFVDSHYERVEEEDRDLNYYIGASFFLTKAKLKVLAQRARKASIFQAFERVRAAEEKEDVIEIYAVEDMKEAARDAQKSQAILSEMVKKSEFVDKLLASVALNYYSRKGRTILDFEYLA